MTFLVNVESEPRTGKYVLQRALVQNAGFGYGNEPVGETLYTCLQHDFDAWKFEYLLARILSVVIPTHESAVVCVGRMAKHTLVHACYAVGLIDARQKRVLDACCDLFLETLPIPQVTVYASSDPHTMACFPEGMPSTFVSRYSTSQGTKAHYFSSCVLRVERIKRIFESYVSSLSSSSLIRVDSARGFTDAVVLASFLREVTNAKEVWSNQGSEARGSPRPPPLPPPTPSDDDDEDDIEDSIQS